ncbi:MAG: pyridoxamine 5'-phosphate oxidase family protein [Desulfopila sp.]
MSKDLQERIVTILHKPQLAALATITEMDNPWVRYVITVGDGNLVIRCATFTDSRKVAQIAKRPDVHLTCGVNSLAEMQPYLQIQGRATVSTSRDERYNFWNDMLTSIFVGPEDPRYAVIIIEPYRIEYCTMTAAEPEIWTR